MGIDLYPHQIVALEKIHNGSIVKGGVGTGKSITALAYYWTKEAQGSLRINGRGDTGKLQSSKDIYILTTAKKRDDLDWAKEAARFGISSDPDSSIERIGLHVDSWNNIGNYLDVKDAFFIFDEQRLVGSGAWVKAFYKIAKRNRWIMLSATPGDNWMDYIPVFVANGFYKNRTEFLRRHVVYKHYTTFPAIDHYVETAHLEKLRHIVLVEMPYIRHTTRHMDYRMVDFDKDKFERIWKQRWNIYENRPLKDVAEMFRVARQLVNSDASRIGATMKLLEQHPKLIIFYNFNYELEALKTLSSTLGYPMAEYNGHKHQDIPEADKWMYLVQYTAGAEGWNCTVTDAMLFYSLNYSYKVFEQSQGRIDRINTPFRDLFYYIFRSNSAIDNAISKAINTKQNFNERSLVTW